LSIVKARQISQVFFLLLFLWFCAVASLGERWWEVRGWPINLFLQLDPLVALGTVLTTGTLYSGLLWALATIVLTILLGRFFCSWVCPFGTLHHVVGFLANRNQRLSKKVSRNRYRQAQSIKYILLVFLLGTAAGDLIARPFGASAGRSVALNLFFAAVLLVLVFFCLKKVFSKALPLSLPAFCLVFFALFFGVFYGHDLVVSSLQTGLLDPIPLVTRSVQLVVLPVFHGTAPWLASFPRHAVGALLLGAIFLAALLLNLIIPRFYCRFVCPLGALFGVLGRFSLWRIAKTESKCSQCLRCEAYCEGACSPSDKIRISECVLCMNCVAPCDDDVITYRNLPSEAGEILSPDLSRRGLVLSLFSGVVSVPVARLGGIVGENWSPRVIRPPGSLAESDFLKRCIKCGQCMRLCPTNIIHPASFQGGLEGLWTPVLNFRVGTSGCQYNCIACGQFCPTSAIRPLTLEEKQGKEDFAAAGPIRMGTAFVDRGRCLPWAMDRPCIVCEENCPVSPKAIFTRKHFSPIRKSPFKVKEVQQANTVTVALQDATLKPGALATGDYFCRIAGLGDFQRHRILDNTKDTLFLSSHQSRQELPEQGTYLDIEILLKRPFVDVQQCIGCGICEHECPVKGLRAIRVSAENETRNREHALLLRKG
jgi:polyferredoxin